MTIEIGESVVALPYLGTKNYLALRGQSINIGDEVMVLSILSSKNYTMTYPSYEWIDGVMSGTSLNLSDDGYSTQEFSFTFPFYGRNYNTVHIGSNGYISFVDTSPRDYSNEILPCSYDPDCQKLIAPLWDDWYPLWDENGYSDSDIFVREFSDKFVITWNDIFNYEGNWNTYEDRSTFQVILYKTGDIRFNYKTVGITNGVTIGINDGDGINYKSHDSLPTNLSSILFTKAENDLGHVALRSEEIDLKNIDDLIMVLKEDNIAFSDLKLLEISGKVLSWRGLDPIPGEIIALSGDYTDVSESDETGAYSFLKRIIYNKTYQTLPQNIKRDYWSPSNYSYDPITANKIDQDYIEDYFEYIKFRFYGLSFSQSGMYKNKLTGYLYLAGEGQVENSCPNPTIPIATYAKIRWIFDCDGWSCMWTSGSRTYDITSSAIQFLRQYQEATLLSVRSLTHFGIYQGTGIHGATMDIASNEYGDVDNRPALLVKRYADDTETILYPSGDAYFRSGSVETTCTDSTILRCAHYKKIGYNDITTFGITFDIGSLL